MPHLQNVKSFRVRHLADKSSGKRVKGFNPETGDKYLVNPNNDNKREGWPSKGYKFDSEVHKQAEIPTQTLERWERDGFVQLIGKQLVTFPGGPPDDPWRLTAADGRTLVHNVVQCNEVIFTCHDGTSYRYHVAHNPGKYYVMDDLPVIEDMDRYGDEETYMDNFYHVERIE